MSVPLYEANPNPNRVWNQDWCSIVNEYTFIDHHSWDAYNEFADLALQVELYKQRFDCLLDRIYADKIYMNKENWSLMKELEIQSMGKPLGRPPKESRTEEYQLKTAKAVGIEK